MLFYLGKSERERDGMEVSCGGVRRLGKGGGGYCLGHQTGRFPTVPTGGNDTSDVLVVGFRCGDTLSWEGRLLLLLLRRENLDCK